MLLKDIEIGHLQGDISTMGDLSLAPLISYLQKIRDSEGGKRHLLPRFGLEIIEGIRSAYGEMTPVNMEAYQEVFEMVNSLEDGLHLKEKGLWALGYPIPHRAFYGTKEFYTFLESDAQLVSTVDNHFVAPLQQLLYSVVLERFYGMPNSSDILLYNVNQDGVNKYYELKVDFSFVDIQRRGKLPAINLASLRDKEAYCVHDLEPILQVLDPNNFTFRGFTMLSYTDKTVEHVSELLHRMIAELSDYKQERLFEDLHKILSTIAGSTDVSSSLLPVLELNDYPILSSGFTQHSILFRELQKRKENGEIDPIMTTYLKKPYPVLHGVDPSVDTQDPFFQELIQREGLASYISIPLRHRHGIVGFVELYSYLPERLTKATMMIWRKFIPLLTQLSTEIIFQFKTRLERIIMNNYTALNPAVEWRFNEVAARQVAADMSEKEKRPLEQVRFEKVYPIYGAIDVKGSTRLRNSIYRSDNLSKISQLATFLETLPLGSKHNTIAELKHRVGEVENWLKATNYERYTLDVFLFLQEELFERLNQIKAENPNLTSAIDGFVDDLKGTKDKRSDIFETSLQRLNKLVKDEVQHFNTTVQDIFPSYFELFRSDGVEYDMYVGQSITPTKVFDPSFLRTIRKLQIISMAHIGRRTAKVGPILAVPMQVTLLIFMHTSTIDISFRPDERRFDVEGGYNIRYQMVKKRIDKVRIKESKERLVRPNTLAIVFQGDTLRHEIASLLTEVAAIGMLKPNFEFCTLEEVQGVSELQAVRADIILDEG